MPPHKRHEWHERASDLATITSRPARSAASMGRLLRPGERGRGRGSDPSVTEGSARAPQLHDVLQVAGAEATRRPAFRWSDKRAHARPELDDHHWPAAAACRLNRTISACALRIAPTPRTLAWWQLPAAKISDTVA